MYFMSVYLLLIQRLTLCLCVFFIRRLTSCWCIFCLFSILLHVCVFCLFSILLCVCVSFLFSVFMSACLFFFFFYSASYFMSYHTILKTSPEYTAALRNARVIAANISDTLGVEVFPYRWGYHLSAVESDYFEQLFGFMYLEFHTPSSLFSHLPLATVCQTSIIFILLLLLFPLF